MTKAMKAPRLNTDFLRILKAVRACAEQEGIVLYLVGGILRDAFLKRVREQPDFDFCLKSGAIAFGRKAARVLRCGFVVLDEEHGACRLVTRLGDSSCTLDFTDFKGASIQEDLLHRDFTVNTLAVELGDLLKHKGDLSRATLLDLYGGLKDLKGRLVRMTQAQAFDEDPLRIMRAFSLAALFGFRIDKEALRLIKAKKEKLLSVSGERIRDELFKVFDRPDAYAY
ncbi:MAG: phosphohydrolase, partial [Candidatus Omnitrophica bacterium]|nr:phosphohydrolase [Candidatus Omnitrophota bacterium]